MQGAKISLEASSMAIKLSSNVCRDNLTMALFWPTFKNSKMFYIIRFKTMQNDVDSNAVLSIVDVFVI